jgi:hypothetical protein
MRKAGNGSPIISTETLRAELATGASISAIARKYGVQRRGLSERVKSLRAADTIVAVVHPPNVEQSVRQQRTALDLFLQQVELQQEMVAAYEEQFRDENGKLHMCPSAAQHEVRYPVKVGDKTVWRVDRLDAILKRLENHGIIADSITVKGADPRVELRHLSDAIAAKMVTGTELKNMISSTQSVQAFIEALQAAIAEAAPDVQRKIARAVAHQMMIVLPEQQAAAGAGH